MSALQRHADGAVGYRGPRAPGADSGWGPGPRNGAPAAAGLSMDRGASGSAATTSSSPPSAGSDPRYLAIPRWGLVDRVVGRRAGRVRRQAPPAERVRTAFFMAAVALGAAAVVHLVRYLLLVINRNTLLNWLVADAAALLSVLASLAAIAAVMNCAVVLTRWLIARRAAAFEHAGRPESRSRRALWAGTLLPPSAAMALAITFAVVAATTEHSASWALMAACVGFCCLPLVAGIWSLVYVIELAKTEDHYARLRHVIWGWWLLWLLSSVTSVFASVTSGAHGLAGNSQQHGRDDRRLPAGTGGSAGDRESLRRIRGKAGRTARPPLGRGCR